ncbi:MAG: hypothetical protein A2521_02305 [Deltaproteobacteria bacterium RIFOXYD12_FULL_57_12]|nr:MAG: hypothetical protein A2521_02305 [Deltaproteobacteria bacterium RIFOXYD12_FULL_57_12]
MLMKEIKKKARELGLQPGRSNKTEMIRAIQTQEGNSPCFQTAQNFCDQQQCCWQNDCLARPATTQ